jgi:hypothetical protein
MSVIISVTFPHTSLIAFLSRFQTRSYSDLAKAGLRASKSIKLGENLARINNPYIAMAGKLLKVGEEMGGTGRHRPHYRHRIHANGRITSMSIPAGHYYSKKTRGVKQYRRR